MALLVAVSARTASHAEPVRIGLVLEQPLVGRADDPFQHSAYLGLARAASTLHVQGKVVAPAPNESYVPVFSYLARQGYDLSVGIGFLEIADLARVAQGFPVRKSGRRSTISSMRRPRFRQAGDGLVRVRAGGAVAAGCLTMSRTSTSRFPPAAAPAIAVSTASGTGAA